jgi:hypothetical protein
MKLYLPRDQLGNMKVFFNHLGYHQQLNRRGQASSFIRRLGRLSYPRFHIYFKEVGHIVEVNLHLDQKAPSYEGVAAHSGEYDNPLLIAEAEKIKKIVESSH